MATGVPKKIAPINGSGRAIHLAYPGKQLESEILARKPSDLVDVWQGSLTPSGRLYFSENSGLLASLMNDPTVCGKVRLIYIDPPFATQTAFHSRKQDHAYADLLSGADYLEFLRERLLLLHRLLSDDGALYLHLDAKMVFPAKLILDEIFGSSRFRSCVTRKKCNPKNYTSKQYGNIADYILFYTKSDDWVWNRPVEEWTPERTKEYQYVDEHTGRRFMKVPVHAPGVRHGETGGRWRGMLPPPGKHWQYPPRVLDELDARGEIFWSKNRNPRRKVYLDVSPGVGIQDIWLEFRDAHNQNICITGYPTEKNRKMLKRIIEASSNPGDLVLDCFAGSGTTLAVAEELGRQWIGADNSIEAIATTLKRFAVGTAPMGDFVGARKTDLLTAVERRQRPGSHRAITSFRLIAERSSAEQVATIAAQWAKELEPNHKANRALSAMVPASA